MENLELRKKVAQMTGHTVYPYSDATSYFMLLDPRGDPVIDGREGERKTEAEAWADAPKVDVDLALAFAVFGIREGFSIKVDRDSYWVRYKNETETCDDLYDLPEMICEVFVKGINIEEEKKQTRIKQLKRQIADYQSELRELEGESEPA